MIGIPFEDNDLACLGAITEIVANLVARCPPGLRKFAARFSTTDELAAWIRSLPQRDDTGSLSDIPKVLACEPWQRLRLPADDPNCVERAALYLAVAEVIDPWPVRRLSTLDLEWGRHTFPIEEGVPLVLDPRVTEEDLKPVVSRLRGRHFRHGPVWPSPVPGSSAAQIPPAVPEMVTDAEPLPVLPTPTAPPTFAPMPLAASSPTPVAIDIAEAIDYTSQLAQMGARDVRNGPNRAIRARNAIRGLIDKGAPAVDRETIEAIGWFLATAEKVAHGYGQRALKIVQTTAHAIADLMDDVLAARQRNLSISIGGASFEVPSWLSSVGSVAGKIGLDLGAAYVAPKLAAVGVTDQMISLVEQELNAEGLTLGPIAKPGRSFTSALNSLARRVV